jgi:putative alpha-1,2-mannosidase
LLLRYLKKIFYNSVAELRYTKNYLEHFELLKGGVLDIKMGDEPNMNRGVSSEDFPYSFSVNEKQKK